MSVSFVGANYALRARHIGHLLHHGIDVHAYETRAGDGERELHFVLSPKELFLRQKHLPQEISNLMPRLRRDWQNIALAACCMGNSRKNLNEIVDR